MSNFHIGDVIKIKSSITKLVYANYLSEQCQGTVCIITGVVFTNTDFSRLAHTQEPYIYDIELKDIADGKSKQIIQFRWPSDYFELVDKLIPTIF